MKNLTELELDNYIRHILVFPGWKEEHKKCRDNHNEIKFVTQLIQRFQEHCYFHNIGLLTTPPEERRSVRAADCVTLGMSGAGGVCVHLNAWFVSVLKSLGFQAHISAGNYFAYIPSPEGTHCIGILQLQGKVYGVDVGCSNPIDEPIPLHQLPYTRRAGGVRYEYRYNADGDWYERWQLDGTILGEKFEDENEAQLRYRFTTRPKPISYFEENLVTIFTDAENSKFLRNLLLFRALPSPLDSEEGDISGKGRKFVVIFTKSVAVYDAEGKNAKKFESYREMESFIIKYFPKLDSTLVTKALTYLDSL